LYDFDIKDIRINNQEKYVDFLKKEGKKDVIWRRVFSDGEVKEIT
jgi:hypothetical protein